MKIRPTTLLAIILLLGAGALLPHGAAAADPAQAQVEIVCGYPLEPQSFALLGTPHDWRGSPEQVSRLNRLNADIDVFNDAEQAEHEAVDKMLTSLRSPFCEKVLDSYLAASQAQFDAMTKQIAVERARIFATAARPDDASFGKGGVVLSSSPLGGAVAVGYGLALDAQDRIVVAGIASDTAAVIHPIAWRFQPDGEPDASFGKGGFMALSEQGWAWSLMLDAQGRPVVGGFLGKNLQSAKTPFVRRFMPDGGPDPSFGRDGIALARNPLGGGFGQGTAVRVLGSGEILLAGAVSDSAGAKHPALWAFTPRGESDAAFAKDGVRVLPAAGKDGVAFAIGESSSSYYVTGLADSTRLTLWKLGRDGALDMRFGQGGVEDLGFGTGRTMLFDPKGFWVSGYNYKDPDNPGVYERTLLARLDASGRPDVSNGPDGVRLLPGTRAYPDREVFAGAWTADGSFYLAGYAAVRKEAYACFWSLDSRGRPRPAFGERGVYVPSEAAGGQEERLFGLIVDSQGRPLASGFSRGADNKLRLVLRRLSPPEK